MNLSHTFLSDFIYRTSVLVSSLTNQLFCRCESVSIVSPTMSSTGQSLSVLLENIAKEQQYDNYVIDIKPVSSDGANYTSGIFLIKITTPNKDDLNVFAKVAIMGEKLRANTHIARLYDTERYFYTDLAKAYQKIEDKYRIPEAYKLLLPKFYGYNDTYLEETIVLENLVAKGFITHDRFKSVNWEYATASVAEVAKLHALSMAHGEEYPEEHGKLLSTLKFKMEGNMLNNKTLWVNMGEVALKKIKEKNKEKLEKFVATQGPYTFAEYLKPLRRPVLIHGDYRPSNLMHKVQEDGSVQVVIVDYQTVQVGSPVIDLYFFIFTGTDAAFRAKYFDELMEYYYSQLCEALRRLSIDPEKLYCREDFDYERKKLLPYGLSTGVYALQVLTAEAENTPKFDENIEWAAFAVKTSDVYVERLNEVVDDFIRWGEI